MARPRLFPPLREPRPRLTTDFRDVFAEILAGRMGIGNLKTVFPGYDVGEGKRLGVIA